LVIIPKVVKCAGENAAAGTETKAEKSLLKRYDFGRSRLIRRNEGNDGGLNRRCYGRRYDNGNVDRKRRRGICEDRRGCRLSGIDILIVMFIVMRDCRDERPCVGIAVIEDQSSIGIFDFGTMTGMTCEGLEAEKTIIEAWNVMNMCEM
jgi:hypothetical protein